MKFVISPFIIIIIPIVLLCWLVIAYDDPTNTDPYEGEEGEEGDTQ